MKITTVLAALALVLMPGIAAAMCGGKHMQTSAQCGEGQVWDSGAERCITPLHG